MPHSQAKLFPLDCFAIIHHVIAPRSHAPYECTLFIRLKGTKVYRIFEVRYANTPHTLEQWIEDTQPGCTIIKVSDYECE